jgi:hypothetical protein
VPCRKQFTVSFKAQDNFIRRLHLHLNYFILKSNTPNFNAIYEDDCRVIFSDSGIDDVIKRYDFGSIAKNDLIRFLSCRIYGDHEYEKHLSCNPMNEIFGREISRRSQKFES